MSNLSRAVRDSRSKHQVAQRATAKRIFSSGGSFELDAPCVTRITDPLPFGVSETKYEAFELEPIASSVALPECDSCVRGRWLLRQLAMDEGERAEDA